MILVWLIIILLAAGLLSLPAGKWNQGLPRWISLSAFLADLILVLFLWLGNTGQSGISGQDDWIVQFFVQWIPQLGIGFHLAIDGLSMLMVAMTLFLGVLAVIVSWKQDVQNAGFFHFNIVWIIAGIIGVFLAVDLFLFYFFWEVMLLPMYFLISNFGHEKRIAASYKFFIFTQGSGLLMLLSFLGIYFIHGHNTGTYTFDYMQLLGTVIHRPAAAWLMLSLFTAFVVKLPLVPFHTWLPDATSEAPATGSVILAGLLWNTAAYGIIRMVLPFFPELSQEFAPFAMALGVAGILYGAKLAFAQPDLKRLITYTSISHMGFLMLGIYAFNELAMQGVVMQLITHSISTSALLIMAGVLHKQMQTRDIGKMGGLWADAPRMGGVGLVFVMATLGLPGMGNFLAEFLVLLGTYQASVLFTVLGSLGLITAAIYGLRILQKVFYGEKIHSGKLADFNLRERLVMGVLTISIFWLGLFPQPVFNTAKPAILKILQKEMNIYIPQMNTGENEKQVLLINDVTTEPKQFTENRNLTFLPEPNNYSNKKKTYVEQ